MFTESPAAEEASEAAAAEAASEAAAAEAASEAAAAAAAEAASEAATAAAEAEAFAEAESAAAAEAAENIFLNIRNGGGYNSNGAFEKKKCVHFRHRDTCSNPAISKRAREQQSWSADDILEMQSRTALEAERKQKKRRRRNRKPKFNSDVRCVEPESDDAVLSQQKCNAFEFMSKLFDLLVTKSCNMTTIIPDDVYRLSKEKWKVVRDTFIRGEVDIDSNVVIQREQFSLNFSRKY
jgi:hypothetical protein